MTFRCDLATRVGRLVVVGTLLGVTTSASPRAVPAPSGRLVILAAGGRVVIVDVASQKVVADSQVAPNLSPIWGSPSADQASGKVFAPLWQVGAHETRVFEIGPSSSSMRLLADYQDDYGPSWLDVGQRSGRLYLISGGGDIVRVLNTATGKQISRMSVQPQPGQAAARSDIYWAAVSSDERRLYESYHGTSTTGIDWFSFEDGRLAPCASTSIDVRRRACIPSHGFFAIEQSGLIADLTGGNVGRVDSIGKELGTIDVGLPGNHMVAFALDTVAGVVYSLGDCGYTKGLSAMSYRPGAAHAPFPASRLCGTTVRLSADGKWLAIPQVAGPLRTGEVVIIDAQTGQTLATIPVHYPIENLIAIR